ncbi:MAG: RlmE family RNA methyltransferase [Spirochaetaceae bacterium]|nr:RlmE family RNA methyltransferase [Spirochaetaceae bacterium]
MARGRRGGADFYSRKARAGGFPARSVWKLEELDRRHGLLRGGMDVLDLGAAPGSWALYARNRVGAAGSVTAVDLQPRPAALGAPDARLRWLQADLTGNALPTELGGRRFHLVLSDAAPATCGNHAVDAARSAELVAAVLELARGHLREGGKLVAKVLQGEELPDLLALARDCFRRVRTAKPAASRGESSETFLLGFEYFAGQRKQ